MIHQLRTYVLTEQGKTDFPARFRDHAARIMSRYGFKIIGAWHDVEGSDAKFLYMLEWPDKSVMEAAWEGFLSDEEWLSIRSSAKLVETIADRYLEPFPLN